MPAPTHQIFDQIKTGAPIAQHFITFETTSTILATTCETNNGTRWSCNTPITYAASLDRWEHVTCMLEKYAEVKESIANLHLDYALVLALRAAAANKSGAQEAAIALIHQGALFWRGLSLSSTKEFQKELPDLLASSSDDITHALFFDANNQP